MCSLGKHWIYADLYLYYDRKVHRLEPGDFAPRMISTIGSRRTPTTDARNFIHSWSFLYAEYAKAPTWPPVRVRTEFLPELILSEHMVRFTRYQVNLVLQLWSPSQQESFMKWCISLKEELPSLLEDAPLITRRRMYFQQDGIPRITSTCEGVFIIVVQIIG